VVRADDARAVLTELLARIDALEELDVRWRFRG
jgi:hypothetical protein